MSNAKSKQVNNLNQVVYLENQQQKRKPKLPLKLHTLATGASGYSQASLRDLERKHEVDATMFSLVIRGLKTSARVSAIIQKEWGVTTEETQSIYAEHNARLAAGNPVTPEEAMEFKMGVVYRGSSLRESVGLEEFKAVNRRLSEGLRVA